MYSQADKQQTFTQYTHSDKQTVTLKTNYMIKQSERQRMKTKNNKYK